MTRSEEVFTSEQRGEFLPDLNKTPLCRLRIARPSPVIEWVEIDEVEECRGMTDVVDVVWLREWTDDDERIVGEAMKKSITDL